MNFLENGFEKKLIVKIKNPRRWRMGKNFEELIAKKITNLLLREFNLFQLKRGVCIRMKTFRSLLSYLRFGKREIPFILDLLRKSDFYVTSSKNGIFFQIRNIYSSSENNMNSSNQ